MPERPRRLDVPSFVRDLDIRPESLPDDIGAAARQLWDSGDHRAALSLLYRGLLSRLAHVHGVPIKDSTTEGDCLALAAQHLFDESRKTYVAQLVRLWQRAVYGGERVADESVHALCEGFARALDDPEQRALTRWSAGGGDGVVNGSRLFRIVMLALAVGLDRVDRPQHLLGRRRHSDAVTGRGGDQSVLRSPALHERAAASSLRGRRCSRVRQRATRCSSRRGTGRSWKAVASVWKTG